MIEKAVNPRFEDYLFNWNETYQFLVGGYGSSKSYHTALKIILKLLREKRTALSCGKFSIRTEILRLPCLKTLSGSLSWDMP